MDQQFVRTLALTLTKWIGSPLSIVIHSLLFISCFAAAGFGYIEWSTMLLLLTTVVSLESIYLSIFIQMTINYTTETIEDVEENLEELKEDVDEMSEDVEEMQEDVGEIKNDVDELQEDVEEISEDVEDISEEEEKEALAQTAQDKTLASIQSDLRKLLDDVEKLKQGRE